MDKITRCCLFALPLICTQVQAAPILQVQDGILTGAKHVSIFGTFTGITSYYDVEFLDGTCAAVFSGCNNFYFGLNYNYSPALAAKEASQALLDQVFINRGAGKLYDDNPTLTRGCSDLYLCEVMTPNQRSNYQGVTFISRALNYSLTPHEFYGNVSDATLEQGFDNMFVDVFDFTWAPNLTWARWTPSMPNNTPEPTSVPEPGMLPLLSLGLVGSLVVRRKAN